MKREDIGFTLRTCLATLVVLAAVLLPAGLTQAALVTATTTATPAGNNFYPASQASDGNTGLTWVTKDYFVGGGVGNYFGGGGPTPVLTFDLGADTRMNAFALWNYPVLGNRLTTYSLKFATAADGTSGFGASIAYGPSFTANAGVDNNIRQDVALAQNVTARYVQMTVTGNNYLAGGGGDRVGLAEMQFNKVQTVNGLLRTGTVTSNTAGTDSLAASRASDGDPATMWVTTNSGSDYFATAAPTPVLTIDLGQDLAMDGFAFWNYDASGNRTTKMSMKFATSADGAAGFGTSIAYNPTFSPMALDQNRQDFLFNDIVTARYVQLTALDNYYPFGGGDRVGFGEIEFSQIPEPLTMATLLGLALPGLAGYLRRRR